MNVTTMKSTSISANEMDWTASPSLESDMEFTSDFLMGSTTVAEQIEISLNPITWGVIVAMCIGTVGVLNNCFTLVVIMSSKRMREKVNNKLIINQSAIDAVASFFLIVNSPTFPNPRSPPGIIGQLWCRLWVSNYFLWSTLTASSFNLIAITIERYMEIVRPFIYKDRFTPLKTKILMGGVWMAGFVFMTLPNLGPSGVIDGVCYPFSLWPSPIAASIAGVLTFVAVYLAPIVIMIYCYSHMILVFRKKVVPGETANHKSISEKKRLKNMARIQRNIMKTLITVAFAFICCWTANQITFFLFNLGVKVDLYGTYFEVFVFFSFSNCCINPFIYTFQYHEFKVAMKKLFRLKQICEDSENTQQSNLPS